MFNASRSTSASSQTWAYRMKLKSKESMEFKEYEEFKELPGARSNETREHSDVGKISRKDAKAQRSGGRRATFMYLFVPFVIFCEILFSCVDLQFSCNHCRGLPG